MKKTRRCITLIEMMIVMFLIALITGVVGYNYRGSLEKGKRFETEVAVEKLETILSLHLAQYPQEAENISTEWQNWVRQSEMVKKKDAEKLMRDGWGNSFEVSIDDHGTITITSEKYSS